MPEPILHHFDLSPFAEKTRLTLGLKGLTWRSVQIPMVMPKPDLTPLTGGYRKTPVLQIGADVYCDTNLIARELERRFPQPTLFASGQAGIAQALSSWADKAFFEPGAALAMGVNKDLPATLINDRKRFFAFMDFSRLNEDIPHLYTQLRAHASLLDTQLGDGRPYLLAAQPGLADINAYFVVWMARGFVPPVKELFAPFVHMEKWEARMGSIGHGKRSEIEASQALQIARSSTAELPAGVDPNDPLQLRAGARVSVTPDDYGKVAVTGELVTLQIHEVAVRRPDPRAGEVIVHFPRIGYRVALA
jgi:glutathione S-transferase